jgi:FMN phosphatase YigB (HAD superfamily)
MSSRLKIVFFDWGGVLCGSMTARIEREVGLAWTPSRRRTFARLNTGRLSLVDAMRRITRGTPWADRWDDLVRITLQHLMSHRNPAVWTLAGLLRGLGLRTSILSNNSVEWACQIGALYNLGMIFSPALFSGVESIRAGRPLLKPDPAFYRHALKRAGVRPHEAALIDDQPENGLAARRLGMESILYSDPQKLQKDLEDLLTRRGFRLSRRGRPRRPPPPCDCC